MFTIRKTNQNDQVLVDKVYEFYMEMCAINPLIVKPYTEIQEVIINGHAFIAFRKENIIGFMTFRLWPDFVEPMSLIVHPESQRRGIGRQLIKAMFKYLREEYRNKSIVAFPNEKSLALVLELGLTQYNRSEIPEFLKQVYAEPLANPKYDNVLFAMSS